MPREKCPLAPDSGADWVLQPTYRPAAWYPSGERRRISIINEGSNSEPGVDIDTVNTTMGYRYLAAGESLAAHHCRLGPTFISETRIALDGGGNGVQWRLALAKLCAPVEFTEAQTVPEANK